MLVGAFHEPVYMPAARADVVRDLAGWFAILVLAATGLSKLGVRNAGRLLQNTLSQTLLALLALAAFVSTAPAQLGAVPVAFVVLFLAGRITFFVGNAQGPLWSVFGHGLGPGGSVLLLAFAWGYAFSA
ncbi:hypothetical protein [Variovorax sp. KK3]|uniref:hypothetical protein n=1 Tax=Variovorax sp. KK3 TaxID=1855728 RepID=UPI00097C2C6E|nr:hypothetical protein [Variovorax sp. KK3]